MLKLLGILCILCSSGGMSFYYLSRMRQEFVQLEQLIEILHVLEQELVYCRVPLPEQLEQLAGEAKTPWSRILMDTADSMQSYEEASVPQIWRSSCQKQKENLYLDASDYQILLELGEVFCFRSLDSSVRLIQMNIERLTASRNKKRTENQSRTKLYCCACYLTGLFAIILFV